MELIFLEFILFFLLFSSFLLFFVFVLFVHVCVCVCVWAVHQSSSFLFQQLISVQCIMERSIARRGGVTTIVCVHVCVFVCVCVLLLWKHAAGLALQQRGWCRVASWELVLSIFLTGVHGLHVGGAGVPLDRVKDGRQLLIGWDLGLELRHQRRLLCLGDRQQSDDSSHCRPLQLVLLLKLLLHWVRLHLRRKTRIFYSLLTLQL